VTTRTRVLVIGGGIAGCSLLYHLTRLGWRDVTLVEKGELTSGSTWHAAGLCTQLSPSYNLTKLLMYSMQLYESLEAEMGQSVSLHRCGSIRLAYTTDRLDEFRHRGSMARTLGLDVELIGPEDVARLFPILDTGGLLGAAYIPSDGHVDPSSLTQVLAAAARARGATIHRQTLVTGMERADDRWLVHTAKGDFEAEFVVNAAGQWAREVAAMVGASLPIVPLQHQYVVTDTISALRDLDHELPVLRDTQRSYYVREEGEGLLVGPFEREPLSWALDGVPFDFGQELLPASFDQISEVIGAAAERIPALMDAGIRSIVNGPDGYTPDGRCLMGEVPGLPNYHVLAGFSIFGIVFGGGAGRYAAEWITEGQPSDNMWELDVRRFGPYAESTRYVAARAAEVYEREYAIHYPHEELTAGRPLKTSPLYDRLAARGAVYGARFGWERPLWFAPAGVEAIDDCTFRRPRWLDHVGAECAAVRERVGILDQTSFAKYTVSGAGARSFLDRLCANRLPDEVGRMALTQMCTPRGGIECDVTVTLLPGDIFYIISAAATEAHDLAWIERHARGLPDVQVENVTARFGVLTLAGPRSRELLAGLTDADISNGGFPFFSARLINVASAPVHALRVSYVGELGWELHHPIEYGRFLYDALLQAGESLGVVDFGYRALDAMRLEKGYRLWGADMSADWTPLEAGLQRFVKLDKGNFIGRDALAEQAERGVARKLACIVLERDDLIPFGGEAVFHGGQPVGYLMSAGYGPTVQATIGYAYLTTELAAPGTALSVELLGELVAARVESEPLFDPRNRRLRS
jgi:dimethylglycine dehydrogenase